ncbi:MAG: restriction endonuclease subunit S [Salinivirgaceae bacterium]|nr:restriction endonuclease subunit S [Salinivirgaceae bacterium]
MTKPQKTWPMLPIGDLLKQVRRPVNVESDTHYREIGIRSHGKGIFHKPETTGKQIGEKRVFWVEPDCLVFNIVFAWEQAVAMTSEAEVGMIASHRFPMYSSRNGKLLPEYVWRYFSTPRGKYDLNIASPGGAGRNKTLGQAEFKRLKIPVPPIEYQREVVEVLSTTDRAISGMEQLIAAKRTLKKGLAQQLLTGKYRLPGFGEPAVEGKVGKDSKCGWIPSDWENVQFGTLGSTYTGLACKTKEDFGDGYPYIPYLNIFDNTYIDPTRMDRVRIGTDERQHTVQYGDIFFTTSSETRLEVGMAAVMLSEVESTYLNSFCFGFRLNSFDRLWPEFAGHLLRGSETRRAIARLSQGATRYNLPQSCIKELYIPLPSLLEQKHIAALLGKADREIALLEKKLAALRELKKGLMQKLLTGPMLAKESARD